MQVISRQAGCSSVFMVGHSRPDILSGSLAHVSHISVKRNHLLNTYSNLNSFSHMHETLLNRHATAMVCGRKKTMLPLSMVDKIGL